uniref:Uncharacterized protein n=1 Tax=Anguilla anguilla TaxID=7936 RepID=A0A0E9SCL8_ANGAN
MVITTLLQPQNTNPEVWVFGERQFHTETLSPDRCELPFPNLYYNVEKSDSIVLEGKYFTIE